jgi:hypothetical protein
MNAIHTLAMAGVALSLLGALFTRPSPPKQTSIAAPQIPKEFGWQAAGQSSGTFRLPGRRATLTLTPKTELFDGRTLLSQTHGVSLSALSLLPYGQQGTYATVATPKGTIYATCLHTDGTAIATREEYVTHQNRRAAQPETLWGYFLGHTDLRQWQCLWLEVTSQDDFSPQEFKNLLGILAQQLEKNAK